MQFGDRAADVEPHAHAFGLGAEKGLEQAFGVLRRDAAAAVGHPDLRLLAIAAGTDVYQALQTGVVDGTENPISNLYTQKMHEVQKHLALTNHGYLGYAVITNKKFWDGLPAPVRTQLEQALKESTEYANKIAREENDKALEAVRASGKTQVTTLTEAERLAFKKALVPVHKKMESRIGAELIQSIYQETGFDPAKL